MVGAAVMVSVPVVPRAMETASPRLLVRPATLMRSWRNFSCCIKNVFSQPFSQNSEKSDSKLTKVAVSKIPSLAGLEQSMVYLTGAFLALLSFFYST